MKLTAQHGDAPPTEFECFDTWVSRWVCEPILAGETYPQLLGPSEVASVVDVGANCGAASVYFARCYPEATVHAVEPGREAFKLLERNARPYPNIRVHRIGLYSSDRAARLYAGKHDAAMASIHRRPGANTAAHEEVALREARSWLLEQGLGSVDVLKLDAEGCEPAILENIRELLPAVGVIYAESEGGAARQQIDRLVDPTHEAVYGMLLSDQAMFAYVERQLRRGNEAIAEFVRDRVADTARPRSAAPVIDPRSG